MKFNFYTIGGGIITIGVIVVIIMIIIQRNKQVCEDISRIKCSDIDKK